MLRIGSIRVLPNGDVEWEIPDLESPAMEIYCSYYSPDFDFGGEEWLLVIWPNGRALTDSLGYLDVGLENYSSGDPISVRFSIALKTVDGQKDSERQETEVFENIDTHSIDRLLSRTEYRRRKSEFLIAGCLTIVCTIKILNAAEAFEDLRKKLEITAKEKDDIKKELDASKADNEILLKNNLDLEADLKTIRKNIDDTHLCEDFKKVLLNGLKYDLTLKVGDKELRAHQDILRARSKVFESMLSHDMQEQKSGVIDIPDCDANAMEEFLCYIYTGRIDTLEESNMLNLYYIADKYDMKGLKEKCSSFIQKSISSTNFCKVIQLALNHSDSTLLEHTTEYFTNNMLDIMRTVEWQIFMKDNLTVANELTIKSVEKMKNVKI